MSMQSLHIKLHHIVQLCNRKSGIQAFNNAQIDL